MVWSNDSTTALIIPPGATSGQRIIIDSNGIIMYDSSNLIIFAIALQGFNRSQLESGAITLTDNGSIGSLFEFYGPGNPIGSDWYYSAGGSGGFAVHNIGFPNGFSSSRLRAQFWPGIQMFYNLDAFSTLPFGYRFSNNDPGFAAFYHEEYSWTAGQAIGGAGATTTLIYPNLVKRYSDYAAAYNTSTGVWTCPTDGIYTLVAEISNPVVMTTAGRFLLQFVDNNSGAFLKRTEVDLTVGGNPGLEVRYGPVFIAKGTQIVANCINGGNAFTSSTVVDFKITFHLEH